MHLVQHATIARHVVVERRIRSVRGHHRITRFHEQSHKIPQEPVNTLSDDQVFRRTPDPPRQRGDQVEIRWVRVLPSVPSRLLHRRQGLGRGAEHAFIGAKPRPKCGTAVAFLHFGADKRHGRGQLRDQLWVTGSGHV